MDRERQFVGATVAYFDLSQFPVGAVRRGTATGPVIVDPGTEEEWIPVRLPGQLADLVPAALIVDVIPGGGPL